MKIFRKEVRALCESNGCNPDDCTDHKHYEELLASVTLENFVNPNPMHGASVPLPDLIRGEEKCIKVFEEGGTEPIIVERRTKVVLYCQIVHDWCKAMNEDPIIYCGKPWILKECEGPEHCTDRSCYEMVVEHAEWWERGCPIPQFPYLEGVDEGA